MTNLDPVADRAVRDAVDAFMEGRLTPELPGETVFETKNSRYRLLDGIVYAAPDDSLIGSELVGWLMESRRRSVVESAWQPGSRAVLVDRHRARKIIVTSTTRLMHLEEHVTAAPPTHDERAPSVPFSPRKAPIVPSTPPPARITSAPPPKPAIHLPPRPIVPRPTTARSPPAPAPLQHPKAPNSTSPRDGEDDAGWELTSAEFEVDGEITRAEQVVHDGAAGGPKPRAPREPSVGSPTKGTSVPRVKAPLNAPRPGTGRDPRPKPPPPAQASSSKSPLEAPESASGAPIPLVRPLQSDRGGAPRPRR